ncbi:hypothetical protein HDU76_008106 [Blyttiomyces sp. JEL0837]|nr:hypothetical protein HDU76_008106 [Blyttiomyces sp. JEL0837]
MKNHPPDTTDDYELYDESIMETLGSDAIPRALQFGPGVDFVTQVINFTRIRAAERIELGRNHEEEAPSTSISKALPLPTIAFGSRMNESPTALGEKIAQKKTNLLPRARKPPAKKSQDKPTKESESQKSEDSESLSQNEPKKSVHKPKSRTSVRLPPIQESRPTTEVEPQQRPSEAEKQEKVLKPNNERAVYDPSKYATADAESSDASVHSSHNSDNDDDVDEEEVDFPVHISRTTSASKRGMSALGKEHRQQALATEREARTTSSRSQKSHQMNELSVSSAEDSDYMGQVQSSFEFDEEETHISDIVSALDRIVGSASMDRPCSSHSDENFPASRNSRRSHRQSSLTNSISWGEAQPVLSTSTGFEFGPNLGEESVSPTASVGRSRFSNGLSTDRDVETVGRERGQRSNTSSAQRFPIGQLRSKPVSRAASRLMTADTALPFQSEVLVTTEPLKSSDQKKSRQNSVICNASVSNLEDKGPLKSKPPTPANEQVKGEPHTLHTKPLTRSNSQAILRPGSAAIPGSRSGSSLSRRSQSESTTGKIVIPDRPKSILKDMLELDVEEEEFNATQHRQDWASDDIDLLPASTPSRHVVSLSEPSNESSKQSSQSRHQSRPTTASSKIEQHRSADSALSSAQQSSVLAPTGASELRREESFVVGGASQPKSPKSDTFPMPKVAIAAEDGIGATVYKQELETATSEEDETLELVFDAVSGSYRDPKTGKHYLIDDTLDA